MAAVPIIPFALWLSGTNQNSIPANDNALRAEILAGLVISKTTTAQPASPTDDDIYIIPAGATGAQWSLLDADDLVIFKGGSWYAFAPVPGVVVNFDGSQEQYAVGSSGGWEPVSGGGGSSAWADLTGIPSPVSDIAALTDPGADRLLFWDDSAGAYTHLQLGTNLSITGTTLDASGGGSGTPAGSDKQIQYNASGAFGAEAGFEYDSSTNTMTVPKVNEGQGSNIASATTTDIGAATGNYVHITGTTTITGLGSVAAGARRVVVFDGALTLTHNATSLILPTGASITTAAGDAALCVSEGSGNWRVAMYQKKDGTALSGGSGSLTGFTAALSTTGANSTVNASSLTASGGTTNQHAVLSPKGTGGVLGQIPDSTSAGGNARGVNSVDWQTSRTAASQVAQSANSTISGGHENTVSNVYGAIGGGRANVVSLDYGVVAGGWANTASGLYSGVTNGRDNIASGQQSRVGGSGGNARGIMGADIYGIVSGNQRGDYGLQRYTTTATQAVATVDFNATPSTANQIVLSNTMGMAFTGLVIAKQSGSTDTKVWKFEGGIVRGANAGTTALTAAVTPTVVAAAAGASAWAVDIDADTTLGCLRIRVTGEAAKNINWTVALQTAEVVI